eukprot:CAMPEP_0119131366 /NCGR_PEP_ID=MMETSP1310-20130426/10166_1 /TAXON_ID=464262 /ORGANISM="Genus nov. species nov., Strain RCC2339" /LENGTH=196 /DNA_ID=CAMNT_0007121933 /DNA_START=90 /DNA_END=677 /DNA_ORIENTATION=-
MSNAEEALANAVIDYEGGLGELDEDELLNDADLLDHGGLIEEVPQSGVDFGFVSGVPSASEGVPGEPVMDISMGGVNQVLPGTDDDTPLGQYKAKHREYLAERERQTEDLRKKELNRAEAEIKEYFAERAKRTEKKRAANRAKANEQTSAFNRESPWANIATLADLDHNSKKASSEKDTSRMREVLMALAASEKPS